MTVPGLTLLSDIPPAQPIRTQWAEPEEHQKHPQKSQLFDIAVFISLFLIYFRFSPSLVFVLLLLPRLFLLLLPITVAIFGGARISAIRAIRETENHQEWATSGAEVNFLTSPSSSSCSLHRDCVLGCGGVCCAGVGTLASWTGA